jgi:hypothetical protein
MTDQEVQQALLPSGTDIETARSRAGLPEPEALRTGSLPAKPMQRLSLPGGANVDIPGELLEVPNRCQALAEALEGLARELRRGPASDD